MINAWLLEFREWDPTGSVGCGNSLVILVIAAYYRTYHVYAHACRAQKQHHANFHRFACRHEIEYIYIYIHLCMYAYMYMRICMHVQMGIRIYTHMYICTYEYTQKGKCMYTYIYIYRYTCENICVDLSIFTRAYIHIYPSIHMHDFSPCPHLPMHAQTPGHQRASGR